MVSTTVHQMHAEMHKLKLAKIIQKTQSSRMPQATHKIDPILQLHLHPGFSSIQDIYTIGNEWTCRISLLSILFRFQRFCGLPWVSHPIDAGRQCNLPSKPCRCGSQRQVSKDGKLEKRWKIWQSLTPTTIPVSGCVALNTLPKEPEF